MIDIDTFGVVTGSAAVISIVKSNLGFNVNNDFISRLEAEGPLKDLELVDNSIGRGFQARNFSRRDLMVIYAVLFVENSLAEMARNTRTPYKYQYYALGRYYYEKYERIYERYSMEEFIHFLPDNIIKEGIDSGVINAVAVDSRQYNEDVAKAVVVTFFYYMSLLDRTELVNLVEFTEKLKSYVKSCKATLLSYSPARIKEEAKSFKNKDVVKKLAEVRDITFPVINLAKEFSLYAKERRITADEVRAWMELVYRADTNKGYLAQIAVRRISTPEELVGELDGRSFQMLVKFFTLF